MESLAIILSRIQFGMSVGLHFVFPAATLGITFFILLSEIAHVRTGQDVWRRISTLGVRVLGLIFAMGVATGIIMPFAFGTNWGGFVKVAGSVFGTHLAIEAVFAFMVETAFLGVLLFGRTRVSKTLYLVSAILVFFGSHLSGFIIVSADSWMQMPFHSAETLTTGIPLAAVDGFHLQTIVNGVATVVTSPDQLAQPFTVVLDDVLKVAFTPTAVIRFVHTMTACWLTGAVIFAGIAVWYIRKQREVAAAKKVLALAIVIGIATAIAQPLLGHEHITTTNEWQPTKSAAMEGVFKDTKGAPLYAFGVPNTETRETWGFGIPGMLSFFDKWDFNYTVRGVDDLIAEGKANYAANKTDLYKTEAPPIVVTFESFRFMVFMGVYMIGVFLLAAIYYRRHKGFINIAKWLSTLVFIMVPTPFIAVEFGWISAEIGRQPWVIYGILKTDNAASAIPAEYVVFSLAIFTLIYVTIFTLFFRWLPRIIQEGFEENHGLEPIVDKA